MPVAQLLLQYRAEVNIAGARTPPLRAIFFCDLDLTEIFVAPGADLEHLCKYGKTAFYHAAAYGAYIVTKWLLAKGLIQSLHSCL